MDEHTEDHAAEEKSGDKMFKRQDLLAAVIEKTGLPRGKAMVAMDAVFEGVTEALRSGHEIRLVGFGTFTVTSRKAGKGRDPRTGAEIDIPASKSVRFRPGKGLRDSIVDTTVA